MIIIHFFHLISSGGCGTCVEKKGKQAEVACMLVVVHWVESHMMARSCTLHVGLLAVVLGMKFLTVELVLNFANINRRIYVKIIPSFKPSVHVSYLFQAIMHVLHSRFSFSRLRYPYFNNKQLYTYNSY